MEVSSENGLGSLGEHDGTAWKMIFSRLFLVRRSQEQVSSRKSSYLYNSQSFTISESK